MKKHYIRGFDGLRTIGVIFVILYHMFPQNVRGGYLGVVLFFVVSGYLITDLLIQEYDKTKRIDIKSFYIRRIKRLYPAVILVILCTSLYAVIFQPNFLNHMRMVFVSNIFAFNNWWQIARGSSYFTHLIAEAPFSHLYSLAIEAQFYLIWPIICLFLLKKVKRRSNNFILLFFLAFLSALEMAILFKTGQDPTRIYYGTDTRAFSILMGAGLAFIWPSKNLYRFKPNQTGKKFLNKILFAVLVLLFVLFIFLPDQSRVTYRGGMFLFSFLACILVALVAHPNLLAGKIFSNRIFDYIGKRSYGIYLWQMPILTLAEVKMGHTWQYYVLSLLLIWLCSELSYQFVEKPLRKANYHILIKKELKILRKKPVTIITVLQYLRIFILLAALVVVAFSPNMDNEQNLISEEIQENEKAIQKAKNKKIKTKNTNKDKKVDSDTLKQFDDLASQYDVTSYQLYQASQEPILAVGDSMFTKTYNDLAAVFPNMVMDAIFGLTPADSISIFNEMIQQYPDVDTIMVSLGTNMGDYTGILNQEQIDQIMKILEGKKVYWATINLPSSTYWWTDEVNALLEDASKQYDNLTIVDWYGISSDPTLDWFESDLFHPNTTGSIAYTQLWINTMFKDRTQDK